MITEVFIGNLKSEKFDYNKIGETPKGSYPEIIGKSTYDDGITMDTLFWHIIQNERTKQSDWGCWVLKLSKEGIIDYLNQEKYNESNAASFLLDIAKALEDNKEYLLVAFEDIMSPPWD